MDKQIGVAYKDTLGPKPGAGQLTRLGDYTYG
jgi:hypothetical protein